MFLITRIWFFSVYSYEILYENWNIWSFKMKLITLGYFIGLSLFHILITVVMLPRLFKYMQSKSDKDVRNHAILMKRAVSVNDLVSESIELPASVLFDVLDLNYNKRLKSKARITKLPFRRTVTEPQFKFE